MPQPQQAASAPVVAPVDPYAAIATPVQQAQPTPVADPYAALTSAAPITPSTPAPAPTGNRIQQFFDSANAPTPSDSTLPFGLGVGGRYLKHTAAAIEAPFVHPLNFLQSLTSGIPEPTVSHLPNGSMVDLPSLAPAEDAINYINSLNEQRKREGLPLTLAGVGGDISGNYLLGAAATATPFTSHGLPPLETPIESSARAITKAVEPAPNEAIDFSNNVERHWGDLNDYARRTNNPLQTHQDYVKAAAGAGNEALQHYKSQIVEPVGSRTASIDPALYEGRQAESAPGTASISDINSRVNGINAEERLLKASDQGDLAARQRLLGLGAEKSHLLDILHQSLSDLSGTMPDGTPAITPEQIAALRQKGPSLLDISDTMNRADFRRLVTPDSGNVPGSKIGILAKVANTIRGGPVKVANSRLVSAAKNAPMEATALPQPAPAAPQSLPPLNRDFLHANDLEQAAQDAARGRDAQVTAARAQQQADYLARVKAGQARTAAAVGKPYTPPQPTSLPPIK